MRRYTLILQLVDYTASYILLKASCLMLEINEFRCYEMKIVAVDARCATEAFSAAHTEDCEGWWSSGCHGSLTEN